MRRRTNKSSKVPNVKLRPAPAATALQRTQSEHLWAEDSQPASDDTAVTDFCPRPFKGFIMCATGIKDKPTLFRKALELGATSVSAFTDRVTHLVAETHGGAKYMCALERKIPIVKPSWVEDNYQIWLKGDDVDLKTSLAAHRLPIFSDIVLCLSGITDVARRVRINKLVTENGGTYMKHLERPVKVTHLLCSGEEETEKMRYAEKFNNRKEALIHLVWEEWFWDSLEFGGRFDETTYQVSCPRPERKAQPESMKQFPILLPFDPEPDLWTTAASSPPPSALPSEADDTSVVHPPFAKKQATSSSETQDDDDDEIASVKVLPAVTLQIWGSLLSRRGYQISGTKLFRTNSAPAAFGTMEQQQTPKRADPGRSESVISVFRRANSFVPVKPEPAEASVASRQPFRRTTTSGNVFMGTSAFHAAAQKQDNGASSSSGAVAGPSKSSNMMFAGQRFCVLGEAKTAAVKNAIESYGGRIVGGPDEEVDFIIVRLVSGSKLFREEADQNLRSKYRTECWLERCIFEDQICPPEKDVSFTPLAVETPILDAETIILSFSGFDQSESCSLRRLLRALGITLAPSFSRRTTHLLCPSGTGLKFDKAREWGIPVVDTSWLSAMARSGMIPPNEDHLVSGSMRRDSGPIVGVDVKGKGKAKVVPQDLYVKTVGDVGGSMMFDITNTDSSESPVEQPCVPGLPAPHPQTTKLTPQTSHSSSSSITLSFGRQGGLLGKLPTIRTPSKIPLPLSAQTSEHHLGAETQEDKTEERSPGLLTWQELEQERLTGKVPSSRTPSPMKVPMRRTSSRSSLSSPLKIDHEATKALQESITRALKRHTSDEDEVLNRGGGGGRNAKRQRPQRHKAPSRQTSEQQISEISAEDSIPIPLGPFVASSINPFESFDVEGEIPSHENKTVVPLDRQGGGGGRQLRSSTRLGVTGEEGGMRVLYEDPGQVDERKKLMSLLKSQTQRGGKGQQQQQQGSPPKVVKAMDVVGGSGRRSGRVKRSGRLEGF